MDWERVVGKEYDWDVVCEPGGEYGHAPLPLGERTRKFALRIIQLYCALPKRTEAQVIGKQLLRSGTSVGANYREGSRGRSDSEFIAKLEISLMELEETCYWIELLRDAGFLENGPLLPLLDEARQLNTILTTIIKRVKDRRKG